MATILVHVMPKPEILDPQGKAVGAAMARLGYEGIAEVRQGKRFEITVDGEVTDELLARVREAATTLLSNPVIEDVVQVKVVGQGCGCGGHGHGGHGHADPGHGHAHGGGHHGHDHGENPLSKFGIEKKDLLA
jgi:phosphoribosylformylglycinamidine synthase